MRFLLGPPSCPHRLMVRIREFHSLDLGSTPGGNAYEVYMLLEKIEYPFSRLYTKAYVYTNNEGRKVIRFKKDGITVKGMAYSRYLMAVKLGRFLTDEEQVDHIDNDKTNDSIDNLQILTAKENTDKYQATLPHGIHGTNSVYRSGCRCALCKQWHKEATAKYYAAHPEKRDLYNRRRREKRRGV